MGHKRNHLNLFFREVTKTTIKKTARTNNINGKNSGIRKAIQTISRVIITTISVSKNSFFPNFLPNSSFIVSPIASSKYLLIF
jgi:hypothetical protein